ncbi:MAG: DNA-directed polymerase subunit alpha [Patescibacteria group bacterium]|nr:DNA-directed polymerase subunit alpha [Patescibacteria group bacterium]MDQ5970589.1 DNA-directed polymerase subunit alpha [Patescibacteria group bacterium]
MNKISLPEEISVIDKKNNHYQVIIEPCYPGYGVTVGNALRRVMLSSLPGAAVTSFKIEGVQHEFDTVTHVKEDLVEIMLNLKKLRLKLFSDEPVILNIEAKGEKVVTAKDIKKNADVEIMNEDLIIATMTDKSAKLNMEITVERGIGYVAVEQNDEKVKLPIGTVAIDANFSPAMNVGFNIEYVRVGEMTNYEKLIMDVLTDGTMDAREAVSQASVILRDHFGYLVNNESASSEEESTEETEEEPTKKKVSKKKSK